MISYAIFFLGLSRAYEMGSRIESRSAALRRSYLKRSRPRVSHRVSPENMLRLFIFIFITKLADAQIYDEIIAPTCDCSRVCKSNQLMKIKEKFTFKS